MFFNNSKWVLISFRVLKLTLIMALPSIFGFLMPVTMAAINPNCDFYQQLVLGQEYYIYNDEYPGLYPPSTSCRWTGESPPGTSIVLSCEDIQLPTVSLYLG